MNLRADLPELPRPLRAAAGILAGAAALLCARPAALAQSDGEIAAVRSTVSDGYARVKLADGSFQPETYTFGEGGHLGGSTDDLTIDKLSFMDVVRVVAEPLEKKNYVPVEDRNPE